jgi:hypothetical protein
MAKKTQAQQFAQFFALFTGGATEGERAAAERKMDAWLQRNGKTRADIPLILAQAVADDAAAAPPPPPSDPRDSAPHPFDDPAFTPAGLVEGIVGKYVAMAEYVRVIYSLWICFTHVYQRFAIAPRVALVSEEPDSGKTTAKDVARHLVFRPNPEDLGTGAAIGEFLDEGPCTVLLDELDQVDREGHRRLQLIWNLGHKRGAAHSMMIKGRRRLVKLHAPVLAAGVGSFLAPTQKSRTFNLEMAPYTEETKPEREFYADEDVSHLDAVYSYLRHWAEGVKLNLKPPMPGLIRRSADNARGLLAIADSCGPEWGRRARAAVTFLLEKERAERPQITMVRHGLAIFEALELDQIRSTRFNQELKRFDAPDARWTRFRGPSGTDYAHPLAMHEQAQLLAKVGIRSETCWPPGTRQRGGSFRGYKRAAFEEAWRKHGTRDDTEPGRGRLRLITQSD